jgi:regulator of sirC expression with transglutaminase-like and TPR domain
MLIEPGEINALIRLIEDPDESIHSHIKSRIMHVGIEAVPHLEKAWMHPNTDKLTQERIEKIVHDLQFDQLKKELVVWKNEQSHDLLLGVSLISKYQYPDISIDFIRKYIQKIKQDIWLELSTNLTAFEQIKVFNKVFFEHYGFKANRNDYHSPYNSFISKVLETKKGNPLMLSVIYLLIAQELEIPLYGINLPNHFVLGYVDEELSRAAGIESSDLVFYVNPYNKGAFLMNQDVEVFLKELDLPLKDDFLLPCDHTSMVLRNINNLIYAYRLKKQLQKVEELKTLRDIIQAPL